MIRSTLAKLVFIGLMGVFLLSIASCGGDDTPAEKPFEKFIGQYSGTFTCGGALSVINTDNADFEISPPSDPNVENMVTVTVNIVGAGVFPFEATVNGDNLTFSELKLNGYTIDLPVVGSISADLTITGSASLVGTNINGTLNMAVDAGVAQLTDRCAIVGTPK
jgi:hypothetical protein